MLMVNKDKEMDSVVWLVVASMVGLCGSVICDIVSMDLFIMLIRVKSMVKSDIVKNCMNFVQKFMRTLLKLLVFLYDLGLSRFCTVMYEGSYCQIFCYIRDRYQHDTSPVPK